MPAGTFRRLALVLLIALPIVSAVAHDGPHAAAPPDGPAVTTQVVLGNRDHTYISVANWCRLPTSRPHLGITHPGLAIDAAGRVFVTTDDPPAGILTFDPAGQFVRRIADDFPNLQGLMLREERGKEGGQESFFYGVDLPGKRAVKLSADGQPVWTISIPTATGQYPDPTRCGPTGIAIAPTGDIYIADGYGSNRIHQFSGKDQKFIRSFGRKGKAPGEFQTCRAIAIDPRSDKPTLLVCDQDNRRLQRFDLDGHFIAIVAEGLRRPCAIACQGKLAAVAELDGRITLLDEHDLPAATLDEPRDAGPGTESVFNAPHAIAFDRQGNLYVADWSITGRIVKLERQPAGAK